MTVEAATPARPSYDEWRDRRWRLTGGFVILLWMTTAVLTVTLGEKPSDLDRLHAELSTGAVSEVEIGGYPADGIGHGYALVRLRWDGWLNRYAEVYVAVPREPRSGSFNPDGLPVIVGDPVEDLRSFNPDVRVTYSDYRSNPGGFPGWEGPQNILWFGIAAWIGSILLASHGPEPWRVTRWGWAWFHLFAGPIGAGLYLLLGGPLGVGRPANPTRRLTGGWAFLLVAVVVGGARSD